MVHERGNPTTKGNEHINVPPVQEVIDIPTPPFQRQYGNVRVTAFTLEKTSHPGKTRSFEDRILLRPMADGTLLFGVLDGHNGHLAVDIATSTFGDSVASATYKGAETLAEAFITTDGNIRQDAARQNQIAQTHEVDGVAMAAVVIDEARQQAYCLVPSDVSVVQQTRNENREPLPTKHPPASTPFRRIEGHNEVLLNVVGVLGDEDFQDRALIGPNDLATIDIHDTHRLLLFSDGLDTIGKDRMKFVYYMLDHPKEIREYLLAHAAQRINPKETTIPTLPKGKFFQEKDMHKLHLYLSDRILHSIDLSQYADNPELFGVYCVQEFIKTIRAELRGRRESRELRHANVPDDVAFLMITLDYQK